MRAFTNRFSIHALIALAGLALAAPAAAQGMSADGSPEVGQQVSGQQAPGQPVSGQIGYDSTQQPPPSNLQPMPSPYTGEPSSLPPVFQSGMANDPLNSVPGVIPNQMMPAPAAPAPQGQAAAPGDACAAYMANYNVYMACQDRIKKVQRMQESKTKRAAEAQAERERLLKKRQPPAPVDAKAPASAKGGAPGQQTAPNTMPATQAAPAQQVPAPR